MINIITNDLSPLSDFNRRLYQISKRVLLQLGTGHTEFIYHRAMEVELRLNNFNYETEKRVLITYQDNNGIYYTLGEERIDLYIHKYDIIVELKAIITNPKETEIAQVYKYYRELKKEGLNPKYGVIINFPQSGVKPAKNTIDFYQITFP